MRSIAILGLIWATAIAAAKLQYSCSVLKSSFISARCCQNRSLDRKVDAMLADVVNLSGFNGTTDCGTCQTTSREWTCTQLKEQYEEQLCGTCSVVASPTAPTIASSPTAAPTIASPSVSPNVSLTAAPTTPTTASPSVSPNVSPTAAPTGRPPMCCFGAWGDATSCGGYSGKGAGKCNTNWRKPCDSDDACLATTTTVPQSPPSAPPSPPPSAPQSLPSTPLLPPPSAPPEAPPMCASWCNIKPNENQKRCSWKQCKDCRPCPIESPTMPTPAPL